MRCWPGTRSSRCWTPGPARDPLGRRTTKKHPSPASRARRGRARARLPLHQPPAGGVARGGFVVGNPPFIGTARIREALGDGYIEAMRHVYPDIGDSGDYVMFWWDRAAELARAGRARRFGLVTTNSLRQTFNRRVVEHPMLKGRPGRVGPFGHPCGQKPIRGRRMTCPYTSVRHPRPPLGGQRRGHGGAHRDDRRRGRRGTGVLQQVVGERPDDDGTAEVCSPIKSGRFSPDLPSAPMSPKPRS